MLSALAAAWILYLTRGTTFYWDDWWFLTERMNWDLPTLLRPHHGHLSTLPILVFKIALEVAGLGGYWILRVINTGLVVLCAWLIFTYGRRRIGDWPALFVACPFLVLGSSSPNIVWPAAISYLGALTAYVAALVALDRERPKAACVFLGLGVMCSGIALAGVAAVLIDQRRRVWVAGLPLAGWFIWSLAYPGAIHTHGGLADVPHWIGASAGEGVHALFGWPPMLGFALLVCLLLIGRWSWRALALLGGALALWVMLALARTGAALPSEARYLYPSALVIALLVVEMLRGRLRSSVQVYALIAACAIGIAFNLSLVPERAHGQREVSRLQWKHPGVGPSFPPNFIDGYRAAQRHYGN